MKIDNQYTALFYPEDPEVNLSLGMGVVFLSTALAVDVPNYISIKKELIAFGY